MSFTDGSFLDEDGKPLSNRPFDWGLSVMMRDLKWGWLARYLRLQRLR